MTPDLKAAHAFCFGNRDLVLKSTVCGCFYCLKTFDPRSTKAMDERRAKGYSAAPLGQPIEWVDSKGKTALCPLCGIDAVLPEASGLPVTDMTFLEAMYERWFNTFA